MNCRNRIFYPKMGILLLTWFCWMLFFQVCEVAPTRFLKKIQQILEMMNLSLELDEFFVPRNLLKVLKSLNHPFE